MSSILILGAGGHGKVVADILLLQGLSVIGFLDDNPALWKTKVLGLPVLGKIETYHDYPSDGLIFGIGNNQLRQKIIQQFGIEANRWITAVHPRAIVAASVHIGCGTVIAAGGVINPDTIIGKHAIINTAATVDHDCTIGDYAHIAPGTHLAGGTAIGIGALMGVGSVTIPCRSVGDWAVVGAGSTVIHNIPANVMAKGTPARW